MFFLSLFGVLLHDGNNKIAATNAAKIDTGHILFIIIFVLLLAL